MTELLLKLDETAKQFKKKAVIFFGEFQQLGELEHHNAIEAAIQVKKTWEDYVKMQRHLIAQNITLLSSNQRRTLLGLAKTPTKEIQSADFTRSLKLSASSIQQAVDVLVRKDLVYKNNEDQDYHLLDPAMCYYLAVLL